MGVITKSVFFVLILSLFMHHNLGAVTTSTPTTTKPTTTTTTTKPTTTTNTKPTTTTTKPTTTTTKRTTTTTKPTTATTKRTTTTTKPTTTTTKPTTTTTKPTTTTTTTTTAPTSTTTKPTTTTTKPTTTTFITTTPKPTTSSATTSQPVGGSCDNGLTSITTWYGGYQAYLSIPITTAVTGWKIAIQFTQPLTLFQVWNANFSSVDNITYSLQNVSYNGVLTPGSVFNTVGFNVRFPGSLQSNAIKLILFNGINICSGTTIQPSTLSPTTPTTTLSPITPTSTTSPVPSSYNYTEIIMKSLLFYMAQRSGHLPSDNPIPFRFDSALGDSGVYGEDLTGGYYDAGDHMKYGFPMACATTVVAWSAIDYLDGYKSTGQLQQVQNMIKWSSDYFLKAHITSNGATVRFYGQVGQTTPDHNYWGRPEDMTMARPAYFVSPTSPGSDLAGETVAALAATSIVFSTVNASYSAQCLLNAKQLYTFAKTYQAKYDQSITDAAAAYASSGDKDELAWAAAWLYRATNDSAYLNDAETFYTNFGLSSLPGSFGWDHKEAGVQVLLAKLTGKSTYTSAAKAFCDNNVNTLPKTPKGLVFVDGWGSLRYAANAAFICLTAAELNINPQTYRTFARKQIYYVLGDAGRSFVVGFGRNPPASEHHRSSSCPNKPSTCDWNNFNLASPNPQILYGAMVGGPDASDAYTDSRGNYVQNEVACDFNAGFQGAVAALQSLSVRNITI